MSRWVEDRVVRIPESRRAIAANPHRYVLGLAVALLAAASLFAAQPAQAKTPCWKNVVQDWYDNGTIDRTYPRHCYTEALDNVGEDVRVYSSIEEDIKAAMQRSSRNLRTPASAGGDEPAPPVTPSRRTGGGDQADLEPRASLFKQSFDKLGPREADSMPIPLLILGGLALLLIAAGASGLVARRVRARRVQAP